jgi:flagellar protein FlaG
MSTISSNPGLSLQSVSTPRPVLPVTPENKPVAAVSSTSDHPGQTVQSNASHPTKTVEQNIEELQRITQELQRRANTLAPELQFTVEQSNGQSVMQFTDRTTNEVIRQFPSEETIQMGKELDKFQRGLMINKKA